MKQTGEVSTSVELAVEWTTSLLDPRLQALIGAKTLQQHHTP